MTTTIQLTADGARQEAERVLATMWGNRGVPVDPVALAKSFGIDVYEVALPEDVAGALSMEPGKDPVIFLSKTDAKSRRRFSCAHELGHFLLHFQEPGFQDVFYRNQLSTKGTDAEERFANNFAANLLMPEQLVRNLATQFPVWVLAQQFDVSREALGYRLENLGIQKAS